MPHVLTTAPVPPAIPPPHRRLRVFVVENHEDTRFLLRWLLEHGGHEVFEASTLGEALRTLPDTHSDVLLSDIGLPDGTGWDLIRSLARSRPPYAIAMSGYGRNEDVARSHQAGYRHHLVKPVEPEALERLLAEAAQELST